MRTKLVTAAILAGALSTLPAAAESESQAERQAQGLLADIERLVAAEQSLGWVVDRVQLEDMYPSLLESICPTLPSSREIARAALQRESQALGDPFALYQANGRQLDDRVEAALAAKRRLLALEYGLEGAQRECPFWLEVDPEFEGLQTDRNRFTLNVESSGVAILRQTAGDWTLGAGGFGRMRREKQHAGGAHR